MTEMTKMTTPIRSINLIENTKIRFFTKKGRKTDGGSGIRREVKIEADSKKETSDLHQKHSKEKFHLEDNYALKWLNRPSNLLNLVAPQWLQIWTFSSEKSVSAISELLFTVFLYKDRSPDRILRSCVSCVEKENEKSEKEKQHKRIRSNVIWNQPKPIPTVHQYALLFSFSGDDSCPRYRTPRFTRRTVARKNKPAPLTFILHLRSPGK